MGSGKLIRLLLAGLAAIINIYIAVYFGWWQAQGGGIFSIFPQPGINLLEIALLGVFAFYLIWQDTDRTVPLLWAVTGVLSSFVILGAWTIGFSLAPATLILLILAISLSISHRYSMLRGAVIALIAAGAQSLVLLIPLMLNIN